MQGIREEGSGLSNCEARVMRGLVENDDFCCDHCQSGVQFIDSLWCAHANRAEPAISSNAVCGYLKDICSFMLLTSNRRVSVVVVGSDPVHQLAS